MAYGLDCSEYVPPTYSNDYLELSNSGKSGEEVTSFGGLINYGQSFPVPTSGTVSHQLMIKDFNNCTNSAVAHDVVMNIINNLYDVTGSAAGVYRINFGNNLQAALNLTAQEIAIATNKG